MKKKKVIARGFTLIELLSVIVILGIIMLVAIPAVTGYISGARNDSYINDASLFIDGVKNVAITKNRLPFADGQVYLFKVTGEHGLKLESGGKQSPYGVAWDEYYTYVAIAKVGENYEYAFAGNDIQGNYIPLSTLEYIRTNIKVLNEGSKEASRKCIGGIAGTRSDNVNECTTEFKTGNWDTSVDEHGNEIEMGFMALKPFDDGSELIIYINGLPGADGKRRMFYVNKIFDSMD